MIPDRLYSKSRKETIDEITRIMAPGVSYNFGELWTKAYQATHREMIQATELNACFNEMLRERLIEHLPNTFESAWIKAEELKQDRQTEFHSRVQLARRGIKVKEAGGWISYKKVVRLKWVARGQIVVIVIQLLYGFYTTFQSQTSTNDLLKENETLEQEIQQLHQRLDTIENIIKSDTL